MPVKFPLLKMYVKERKCPHKPSYDSYLSGISQCSECLLRQCWDWIVVTRGCPLDLFKFKKLCPTAPFLSAVWRPPCVCCRGPCETSRGLQEMRPSSHDSQRWSFSLRLPRLACCLGGCGQRQVQSSAPCFLAAALAGVEEVEPGCGWAVPGRAGSLARLLTRSGGGPFGSDKGRESARSFGVLRDLCCAPWDRATLPGLVGKRERKGNQSVTLGSGIRCSPVQTYRHTPLRLLAREFSVCVCVCAKC